MKTTYPHKNAQPLDIFVYWVTEREIIRLRKENGFKELTKDPIFLKYRFCNTHRHDDRVTRWIAKNWYPHDLKYLWHGMIVARFLNWPPTLEFCGYPEPWDKKGLVFKKNLLKLETKGERIFTGAYIVSTNGATGSKVDHVIKLFDRAWEKKHIASLKQCEHVYQTLLDINGIGSFMAAQIVADLKETPHLKHAPDYMNFVAPGPGSQRGLNRVNKFPTASQWNRDNFNKALSNLRNDAGAIAPEIKTYHLQDLQNCLCEFDKYMRVLNGEGKPRSQYRPSPDPMP